MADDASEGVASVSLEEVKMDLDAIDQLVSHCYISITYTYMYRYLYEIRFVWSLKLFQKQTFGFRSWKKKEMRNTKHNFLFY